MRPSRRPAPRRRSGRLGSHATEDRWSVHTARPGGHACPGSRVAAAPAWRNVDALAARTARGGASRPPAKALEVRWCVHRASISPGPAKPGAVPVLNARYDVPARRKTREIPRSSDCDRSGTSDWSHAEDARRRPGAVARAVPACAGGGAGALREPVPGRAGHVRLGDRRHRAGGAVQRHAAARDRLPAGGGARAPGPRAARCGQRRGARPGAGDGPRPDGRALDVELPTAPPGTAACWTSASAWRSSGTNGRTTLPVHLAGRDRPQAAEAALRRKQAELERSRPSCRRWRGVC